MNRYPGTAKEWIAYVITIFVVQYGTMYFLMKVRHWDLFPASALTAVLAVGLATIVWVILRRSSRRRRTVKEKSG